MLLLVVAMGVATVVVNGDVCDGDGYMCIYIYMVMMVVSFCLRLSGKEDPG